MAPGRPRITIGIQPNTAMFSLVAGSVCAFAWYTEKYRRDEAELEGQLRKKYFRDALDSKERMPQMTAVIKGESMSLDGRMDKLVWGGKAQLKNKKPQNNNSSSLSADVHDDNGTDSEAVGSSNNEEKKTRRKRKKRKQKGTGKEEKLKAEEAAAELEKQQRRKLVLQSSVAGVAVGAVAVAAVTTILGGSKGRN